MNDENLVTIETLAQRAKVTWRTAKKRLVAHGIKPISASRKSELYDFPAAMSAIQFGDDPQLLEAHQHFTEGVARYVLPALFGSQSPMMRHLLGLLREKGLSKAEALVEVGAILVTAMQSMKENLLCVDPKCEIDWIMDASERFPDLAGVELFERYCEKHWPDA